MAAQTLGTKLVFWRNHYCLLISSLPSSFLSLLSRSSSQDCPPRSSSRLSTRISASKQMQCWRTAVLCCSDRRSCAHLRCESLGQTAVRTPQGREIHIHMKIQISISKCVGRCCHTALLLCVPSSMVMTSCSSPRSATQRVHQDSQEGRRRGVQCGTPKIIQTSTIALLCLVLMAPMPCFTAVSLYILALPNCAVQKNVDRKASKGRKLRFQPHPKLVNFMAPLPAPAPPLDLDSLHASMFKSRS